MTPSKWPRKQVPNASILDVDQVDRAIFRGRLGLGSLHCHISKVMQSGLYHSRQCEIWLVSRPLDPLKGLLNHKVQLALARIHLNR